MDDEIEIPIQKCFNRQFSIEQRLTPEEDLSDYENENEELEESIIKISENVKEKPCVVNAVLKQQNEDERMANNGKEGVSHSNGMFLNTLYKK